MRDLGKLIVAKGFKKLPKVQKIAQSGHTGSGLCLNNPSGTGEAADKWLIVYIATMNLNIAAF